jgi:hypothetical protein
VSTNLNLDPGNEAGRPDSQANQLLTPAEAAVHLRCSKSYLDKLRVYGGRPTFLRLGKRKILYRKPDFDRWAAERSFGSTSEYRALGQEVDP